MVVVEEELDDDFVVDPVYDADDRNWVRYRPFWGGFARLVVLVVVLVLAVGWARGRIYGWVDTQITPEGLPGDAIELTIPQGASVNEIAGELQNAGVISNATVFRYWLRCDGELTIAGFLGCDTVVAVEAGDYILYENMDFASVRTVFDAGPLPEVFEIVRIPEGLRWSEMALRLLEENPAFEWDDLEAAYVSLVREASYLPEDAPYGASKACSSRPPTTSTPTTSATSTVSCCASPTSSIAASPACCRIPDSTPTLSSWVWRPTR